MPDSSFREPLAVAARHALEHLEALDARPVGPTAPVDALRARLGRPLPEECTAPEQVIDELVSDVAGGIVGCTSGRFYAWVIGGVVPAALAADWLTSAWDQNAGMYNSSPAAAIAEEVAAEWLKELLGIPQTASFAFVTGCQMAHVTCLAAARHAVLERQGWDVEKRGLSGAATIRVLASRDRHGSVERAIRYLGIGTDHLIDLDCDCMGRLQPAALEEALAASPDSPTIVVLQAGELNTGIFDAFEILIPIARRYNAWIHVDGAFGLWAAATPRYRHLLKGASAADSWATDGHKWLNTPYDCGYAFVADPDAHRGAMSYRASYLSRGGGAREEMDWNPEWSRRARGFTTYAAIRQLGRRGIAERIERCCEHARSIVHGIGALPGAEILAEPVINQGMVRFLDSHSGATDADHNRRTDDVIAAIVASGEAYFGGVTWRGRRAMRVSVCDWATTENDVQRTIRAAELAIQATESR